MRKFNLFRPAPAGSPPKSAVRLRRRPAARRGRGAPGAGWLAASSALVLACEGGAPPEAPAADPPAPAASDDFAAERGEAEFDSAGAAADAGKPPTETLSLGDGGTAACAVVANGAPGGALLCWGRGAYVPTFHGHGWRAPLVGAQFTAALAADGLAWFWGFNDSGYFGNGTSVDPPLPVPSVGGGGKRWRSLDMGEHHLCGATEGGELYCWGRSFASERGDQIFQIIPFSIPTPTLVTDLTGWRRVSLGERHSCALRGGGELSCWGSNDKGQLGTGQSEANPLPAPESAKGYGFDFADNPIASPSGLAWAAVASGGRHTCAIDRSGRLFCWGSNADGQLGAPVAGHALTPVAVEPTGARWLEVSAGRAHTCALRSDRRVLCWGANASGQLGTDGTVSAPTPTPVFGDASDWREVEASGDLTCGVRAGGLVACWGANGAGQGGSPPATAPTLLRPTPVFGLP